MSKDVSWDSKISLMFLFWQTPRLFLLVSQLASFIIYGDTPDWCDLGEEAAITRVFSRTCTKIIYGRTPKFATYQTFRLSTHNNRVNNANLGCVHGDNDSVTLKKTLFYTQKSIAVMTILHFHCCNNLYRGNHWNCHYNNPGLLTL